MSAADGRAGALEAPAVWVNGRESRDISALDRGLHYGDGLFETMAVEGGQVQLASLHLRRLQEGCRRLELPLPPAADLLAEWRRAAREQPCAVLKMIVTRGSASARGYALSGDEPGSRVLLRYPRPPADPPSASGGIRVRIADLRLGENPRLAGLKHCNRLEQVLARREWSDPQIADSLLLSSTGALISGTMANVFLVREGAVLTPRLDRCGVAGVMRTAVLECCVAAAIPVGQLRLTLADLESAQEVFLTSSLTGIRPVRELAGRELRPGAVTQRIAGLIARRLAVGGED